MIKAGLSVPQDMQVTRSVRLLLGHKDVEVAWYGSSYIDQKYAQMFIKLFLNW